MTTRMISGLTALAMMAMTSFAMAQAGGDKMAKPMGQMAKEKSYTGCIEAGSMAGTFALTHATADMDMGKDAMGKDSMKKDTMGKDAMAPSTMTIASKNVDFSKHVGHKVSVTGADDAMGKPDAMGKRTFNVSALKMVAATCGM